MIECKNCGYFWYDEEVNRECCHWESRCPSDCAPCEEEPYYDESYDDEEFIDYDYDAFEPDLEMGFDPYSGCYDFDC